MNIHKQYWWYGVMNGQSCLPYTIVCTSKLINGETMQMWTFSWDFRNQIIQPSKIVKRKETEFYCIFLRLIKVACSQVFMKLVWKRKYFNSCQLNACKATRLFREWYRFTWPSKLIYSDILSFHKLFTSLWGQVVKEVHLQYHSRSTQNLWFRSLHVAGTPILID